MTVSMYLLPENIQNEQLWDNFVFELNHLLEITNTFDANAIKQTLQKMMPEYEPLDYYPPAQDKYIKQEELEIDKSSIQGQA